MEDEANKTFRILYADKKGTDPNFLASIETNYSIPTPSTEATDITPHPPPDPPKDFSSTLSILTVTVVSVSIIIFVTVAAALAFYWFRSRRSRNSKAPETGRISTVNNTNRSDGDDWIELKVLPKVIQNETDMKLELNKKNAAVQTRQKNHRQNRTRSRSRTVCFSDKLLIAEKQVFGGQVSSQEDDYKALDEYFFQVEDNKYLSGWSTLPNRKKFSQNVTNNAELLNKTAGETTTNWNKTNFVTFRRTSQVQESMQDPNHTKISVFEGPHSLMNPCQSQSQNQNQDSSSMTNNGTLFQQRQNTAAAPFQMGNIIDLENTKENECSYFVENFSDFDFPPLPTSTELLQSTVERGEVYETDLFESFKQTMSAKGVVFHD